MLMTFTFLTRTKNDLWEVKQTLKFIFSVKFVFKYASLDVENHTHKTDTLSSHRTGLEDGTVVFFLKSTLSSDIRARVFMSERDL